MRRWLRAGVFALVWLVVAVAAWFALFLGSSTATVVASHDAVVHPTLDGRVRLDLGPYLPDLRFPAGSRIGVYVEVKKTTATSGAELAQRYAAIAEHPDAEERRVTEVVRDLAEQSALRAAVVGLVPLALWALVGHQRRQQLAQGVLAHRRTSAAVALALVAAGVLVVQPWTGDDDRVESTTWLDIQDAIPDVSVPPELAHWQLQGGLITDDERRLVRSAFSTFANSKVFYGQVVRRVPEIAGQLRQPKDGETVAALISDRHDNIGMDAVAEAVAKAGGATVVLDAGDDTSTGEKWEAFSLESLDEAFKKYDTRIAISGNHDNGTFVNRFLEGRGWTHLTGKPVEPFGSTRITGVDDPRSSGLGNWRDEKGLSFDEVKDTIAEDLCRDDESGDRVDTLLVHDANLGATALARGCVDLVLAGHLHVQKGPTRVVGSNGKAGYSYTNGTTGGAAYAIAVGSKLRRDAELTLVTYADDGRPAGLQPVTVRTTGDIAVSAYIPLDLG